MKKNSNNLRHFILAVYSRRFTQAVIQMSDTINTQQKITLHLDNLL